MEFTAFFFDEHRLISLLLKSKITLVELALFFLTFNVLADNY